LPETDPNWAATKSTLASVGVGSGASQGKEMTRKTSHVPS